MKKLFRNVVLLYITFQICTLYQPDLGRCSAQDKTTEKEQPSLTLPPSPTFKSTVLRNQVKEVLDKTKEYDLSGVTYLMTRHKNESDQILALFKSYVHDPSENVRFGVLQAASSVKTPKALNILIVMLDDESLSTDAAKSIYDNYESQDLIKLGGQKLRNVLLRASIHSRYSAESLILLSLYRNDKKIIDFLVSRKASYYSKNRTSAFANQKVSAQIALAELQDLNSLRELQMLALRKNEDDLLFLLARLKFVENYALLLTMVELLNDKGNAKLTGYPNSPSSLKYTRWCDEALVALARKTGYKVPGFKGSYEYSTPRFSDQELAKAYSYFKSLYSSKDKVPARSPAEMTKK